MQHVRRSFSTASAPLLLGVRQLLGLNGLIESLVGVLRSSREPNAGLAKITMDCHQGLVQSQLPGLVHHSGNERSRAFLCVLPQMLEMLVFASRLRLMYLGMSPTPR